MSPVQVTFEALAATPNRWAVDVLIAALEDGDASLRQRALKALVARGDAESIHRILRHWDSLDVNEIELVRVKQQNFIPVIEAWIHQGGKGVAQAIRAAEQLQMTSSLPLMITLAESSDQPAIRRQAGEVVLRLVDSLGQRARENRDRPTVRAPVLSRLLDSLQNYEMHRSRQLLDAFLAISVWSDGDLRQLMASPGPLRQLICHQLRNTVEPGAIELLAGFIRRREFPGCIGEIIQAREDVPFRDALLRVIGHEPGATTIKNLKDIGLPDCCHKGERLVAEVAVDQLVPLIHLYVAASPDPVEKLLVVSGAALRGGETVAAVAATALSACPSLDEEFWMRAAILVADSDEAMINANDNARLLSRLIKLLEHNDGGLVRSVRKVLSPLSAEEMTSRMESLRSRSRRRLGRVISMIDPEAVTRVRDALRHPVLAQRLRAIAMADALAAVDSVSESLAHIVREDHQDARILAAEAMAGAEDQATLRLLQEMTTLPECGVRDAAITALKKRQASSPSQALSRK